jgi:hypothetical protein
MVSGALSRRIWRADGLEEALDARFDILRLLNKPKSQI